MLDPLAWPGKFIRNLSSILGADALNTRKRPTIHVCDIIVVGDMFAL
jgi:hypothetical protein